MCTQRLKQLKGFSVCHFATLLLKEGQEVLCWDESLAFLVRCTSEEDKAGAFALWHKVEGFKENSRWIVAYLRHSRVCFLFDGIDMPKGSTLYAADDVPSRWSPLAHEGESERWIVHDPFELNLSVPGLFPVGFVGRETQQLSTQPTYTIAAISGTEGKSEILIQPRVCFVHSFHLSGFGDDIRMTTLAVALNSGHGW